MLGVSLGTILDITNTADYLKALGQLVNEYDYHTNDHSKQKMVMAQQVLKKKKREATDTKERLEKHFPESTRKG